MGFNAAADRLLFAVALLTAAEYFTRDTDHLWRFLVLLLFALTALLDVVDLVVDLGWVK